MRNFFADLWNLPNLNIYMCKIVLKPYAHYVIVTVAGNAYGNVLT